MGRLAPLANGFHLAVEKGGKGIRDVLDGSQRTPVDAELAETEGFEPSIQVSSYNDLANRRLQPLGHVSSGAKHPYSGANQRLQVGPDFATVGENPLVRRPFKGLDCFTFGSQSSDAAKRVGAQMEEKPEPSVRPGPAYLWFTVRAFTLTLLIGTMPAGAAEYCVTCTSPAAMYACVVQGSLPEAPADPREQLICIAELAKSGGHETCSVPRSAPTPCPGVLKIVSPSAQLPPAPPPVEAEAPPQDVPPGEDAAGFGAANPNAAPPAKPKAPRTVEELAKETVESSKEGLEKAGNAVAGTAKKAGEQVGKAGSTVGKAAKKTWDCVVSLFSDC